MYAISFDILHDTYQVYLQQWDISDDISNYHVAVV